MVPFRQRKAWLAPVPTSEVPATLPSASIPAATLRIPPSVPRSFMTPSRQRKACSRPSVRLATPTMSPSSLIPKAELKFPPRVPRSMTEPLRHTTARRAPNRLVANPTISPAALTAVAWLLVPLAIAQMGVNCGGRMIDAIPAVTGLTAPIFVTAPRNDARLFIVERGGLIRIANPATGAINSSPFLDIRSRISTTGEGGLLSMAFDPAFAANGRFYAYFIETGTLDSVVARYTLPTPTAQVASPGTELRAVSRIVVPARGNDVIKIGAPASTLSISRPKSLSSMSAAVVCTPGCEKAIRCTS